MTASPDRPIDARPVADLVAALDVALAIWAGRDDTVPQPEVRLAAADAVVYIDAAMRELHWLRSGLLGEIRRSDDVAAARTDALLGRHRGPRVSTDPGTRVR